MHAAVVELDALADAVGPAAQHHDLAARGRLGLALLLVGGIQVGRLRRELRRAGVDALVHRTDAELEALVAHRGLAGVEQIGEAPVGEPLAFEHAQGIRVDVGELLVVQAHLELDDLLDLREEPRVDAREAVHLLERQAVLERIADVPDALGTRLAQLALDHLAVGGALVEAVDADLQAAQRLLQRFLEGAADRHHLAHRLHLRGQAVVRLREFLEREARHLGDHVVDASARTRPASRRR